MRMYQVYSAGKAVMRCFAESKFAAIQWVAQTRSIDAKTLDAFPLINKKPKSKNLKSC